MLKLVAGMLLMALAAFLGPYGWLGENWFTVMANLVLFFAGLELWIRGMRPTEKG